MSLISDILNIFLLSKSFPKLKLTILIFFFRLLLYEDNKLQGVGRLPYYLTNVIVTNIFPYRVISTQLLKFYLFNLHIFVPVRKLNIFKRFILNESLNFHSFPLGVESNCPCTYLKMSYYPPQNNCSVTLQHNQHINSHEINLLKRRKESFPQIISLEKEAS